MKELVINKVLSGRFLLTVTCAGVFAYAVHSKLIDAAAVVLIIREVFRDYFGRSDRAQTELLKNGNGAHLPAEPVKPTLLPGVPL